MAWDASLVRPSCERLNRISGNLEAKVKLVDEKAAILLPLNL